MAFGRHQLIKLSPKKTVEGFVGAFFVTIFFAVAVSFSPPSHNECRCLLGPLSRPTVGDSIHALQLYGLPRPGPLFERVLRDPLHAQPRLRLARVPAANLGRLGASNPRAFRRQLSLSLVLLTTTDSASTDPAHHHLDPMGPLPTTHDHSRHLCLARSALWRLLRLGVQARVQHQGLWRLYPRSRRDDGSHGLSVPHGAVQLRVSLALSPPLSLSSFCKLSLIRVALRFAT
jgi:hypothetical protein